MELFWNKIEDQNQTNIKPKKKIPSNSIYLLLRFSWVNSESGIQILPILNYKVPCNRVKMICGVSHSVS